MVKGVERTGFQTAFLPLSSRSLFGSLLRFLEGAMNGEEQKGVDVALIWAW
jgi:hypothetical protein